MIPASYPRVLSALVVAVGLGTILNGAPAESGGAGAKDATAPAAPAAAPEKSVVKVFATVRAPDVYKPWTKQAPSDVTGSGVVIEGKRILTNAHVVSYASQVQVQANLSGDKLSATVEAVAPDIDLAVLKLDDETFFDSHPPLSRAGALPVIKDAVLAYGYPTGGNSLSITKGIVSRIEFSPYNLFVNGLRIQIDAAINPGNSGGPAVVGDTMIGLTFSHLGGSENIGYIIPCEEIDLFLQDVRDGRYEGKPALFDELQTLENDALRSFLKLDRSIEGMVVHEPYRTDPAYPLKKWDLITRIGGTKIDNEGMIPLGDNRRVRFTYLIQVLAKNGKVPLTVMRGGKEMAIELPVVSRRPMVMPDLQGTYPSYFIYGPLVFSKASLQFVGGLKNSGISVSAFAMMSGPMTRRFLDKPAFDGEALVVVSSPFFPHRLSKGYGNPIARVVKTVNGVSIKNLDHLVEVLRDAREEFIAIDFEGRESESLVFLRKEALAATEEILTDNGVRSQGTPDALAIWTAKPAR
jgi:S1-C subfamily serine protease